MTDNAVLDGTPVWSPDGRKILFGRQVAAGRRQLFVIDPDAPGIPPATQLTDAAGFNGFGSWGVLKVTGP